MRWIINVGGYGIVALVVGSIIWKTISAASSKSPGVPPRVVSGDRQDVGTGDSTDRQAGALTPEHTAPGSTLPPAGPRSPASGSSSSLVTPPPAPSGLDTAERLQKLSRLRDQGLVSPEVYEAKRQQILQEV